MLFQTLIALAFIILAVYLSNGTTSGDIKDDPELKLHLRTYKYTTVFYNGTKQSPIIKTMKTAFQSVVEGNGGKAMEVEDVQQGKKCVHLKDIVENSSFTTSCLNVRYI